MSTLYKVRSTVNGLALQVSKSGSYSYCRVVRLQDHRIVASHTRSPLTMKLRDLYVEFNTWAGANKEACDAICMFDDKIDAVHSQIYRTCRKAVDQIDAIMSGNV